MYCKKCGKFIGTNTDICDECKQKEIPTNNNTQFQSYNPYQNTYYYQPSMSQNTSAINLGKAITAVILSTVGLLFMYIGLILAFESTASIVCMVMGLVPSILGFVFGLQSISNFKQTAYLRSGKRIPVLILGIASVANAGTSLFCALILIIVAGAI